MTVIVTFSQLLLRYEFKCKVNAGANGIESKLVLNDKGSERFAFIKSHSQSREKGDAMLNFLYTSVWSIMSFNMNI